MPDDNDGSNTESNGGGGYGGTGNGFGGGDPGFGGGNSYGGFSQVDAATIAGTLAAMSLTVGGTFLGSPTMAGPGFMSVEGVTLSGALGQALSNMSGTQLEIGPGPGQMQASTADFSVASGGPGITDYYNSSGALVGTTFDQAAYDQYNNFMQNLGSSGG